MPPSLTSTSYKSKSEAELAWQIGCRWSYSSSSSSDSSCEGGSSDAEFIPHQNKSKYSQQNKTATIARNQRKNQNSNNKDTHKQRSQSDQQRRNNTQTRSNQHDVEDESYLSHPHHHQMITRDYQYSHPQRNVDTICYENNDTHDRQDNNGLDNDAMGLSNNDETTAVCNNPKKNMVMEKPCCSNNTTFPHPPVHTSPCRAPEAELERSIRQYPASPLTHKPPGGETEGGYNEERSNISRATTKLTESCHEVHAGQNQRLNRGKDFHGQGKPSSTTSNFPPPPETRLQHKQPQQKTTAAPTSHNTLDRKSVRSVRDHFNGLDVHHNNLHVEECALDENSSFSCGLCCNGSQNCIAAQNTISPINYGCTMNANHEMVRSNFEMNTKDHIIVNEAMVSCADNMLINKSANGNCDSDCAAFCAHHSKNAPFCVHNFKNAQFCVHDSKQSNSSTDSGFTEMASAELYSHQYLMNNHCIESSRGEIIMDNDNYQQCNCPDCSQQQLAGNNPQNFMGSQSFCCNFNSATGTAASRGKFLAGSGVSNCCIFPLNQLTTAQNSTLLYQHNHPLPPLHNPSEMNSPGLICKHSACGGELIHNQQIINNNSGGGNSDHNNHFVQQHEEDDQDKYCNQDSQQQLLEQKQIGSSCIQSKRLHCTKTVTRTNDPHQQYFEDDSKLTTATTNTQQQFGQCMQLLTDGLARSSGDYSGEGTHGEQDNHDDNVGGGNMGGMENKDSYDSDSSSEEEIGHIIGKIFNSL